MLSGNLVRGTILLIVALATGGTFGCGPDSGSRAPADVSVTVAPRAPVIGLGGSVQFAAALTGSSLTLVDWAVAEGTGCGSVTSGGLYQATQTPATCHVVARSHADPSVSDTATVTVVTEVATPWRPFSATSPWNTRIPPAPELEPSSAALMADFAASSPYGAHLDVNIPGCSIPLFWADGTTPTYSVFANVGGDGWTGTNGMNATAMMPIPDGAAPEAVCDRHLAVVDQQRALEWACYNMSMGTGGWIADLCATADLAGTGVRPPAPLAQPWQAAHGARACGFPLIAGLIRTEEIAAGRIDHALVVAYPHIRAGAFTPPASTPSPTGVAAPNGIPCGGRIQFDPTIDVTTLGLSRSGQIIVRALQEYGAYVGDFSGALSLYAENSPAAQAYWGTGVLQPYELDGKLDFSRFRVIKFGQMY